MTLENQSQEKHVNGVYVLTNKKTSPVALNNLGAKLIIAGRLHEALRCLTSSMGLVRTMRAKYLKRANPRIIQHGHDGDSLPKLPPPLLTLSRCELVRSSVTIGGRPSTRTRSETTPFQCSRKKGEGHGNTSSQENTKENILIKRSLSSTYIFTDPVILEENKQCLHSHRRCLEKLTAIITFNLGLVHHLLGRSVITTLAQESIDFNHQKRVDLKRECVINLKRAVGFYSISCRIQICQRGRVGLLDPVLAMAQLNNLAQIYDTLGNFKSSKRLFERLLSNLVLYTEYICNKANAKEERERLSGFYRNTARFVLGDPQLAPAA